MSSTLYKDKKGKMMKKQIYQTGICEGCRIENSCKKKFEFGGTCSSKPAAMTRRMPLKGMLGIEKADTTKEPEDDQVLYRVFRADEELKRGMME